jgi:hypothetical protein
VAEIIKIEMIRFPLMIVQHFNFTRKTVKEKKDSRRIEPTKHKQTLEQGLLESQKVQFD